MRINRIKLISELTKRDMSQIELSKLAGVSRVTIGNIKAGKSCSDKVGEKIAAALQIPIDQLLEK